MTEDLGPAKPEYVDFGPIRHRAFKTDQTPLGPDPVTARIPLLGNNDVILGISRAKDSMDLFLSQLASLRNLVGTRWQRRSQKPVWQPALPQRRLHRHSIWRHMANGLNEEANSSPLKTQPDRAAQTLSQ
jgi:hypothetical protein